MTATLDPTTTAVDHSTTDDPTDDPTAGPTESTLPARRLDERRLAAIGGIGFASIVLLANVVQGATPAMDASAAEVVAYLTDHRAANVYAATAYACGALFLLTFASAFFGRLEKAGRADDLVWARLGMIGALLIIPMFAVVATTRLVLLVGTDETIGSPEMVTLVWRLEMAAFLLNSLPIAAAVLGFGVAGARAGLLPRWFARWAPIAAATAVVTAATALAGLEGSPISLAGLVPFLTWMALLLTAAIRQLRRAA